MPDELPELIGKAPSLGIYVRQSFEARWSTDKMFRDLSGALSAQHSIYGSRQIDLGLAALKIVETAKDKGFTALVDAVNDDPLLIHKIAFRWLPAALRKYGLDRQSRIALAIERAKEGEATLAQSGE
jgi:hypothetical protein